VAGCGASLACAVARRGLSQPEDGQLDLAEVMRHKLQATAFGRRGRLAGDHALCVIQDIADWR
jgi:hypothetical protein